MTDNEIQSKVIQFLSTATGQSAITPETDLQSSEIIDSLTIMDFLVFIETEFGVRLDFEDLTPETFRSPATLSQLIASRMDRLKT